MGSSFQIMADANLIPRLRPLNALPQIVEAVNEWRSCWMAESAAARIS